MEKNNQQPEEKQDLSGATLGALIDQYALLTEASTAVTEYQERILGELATRGVVVDLLQELLSAYPETLGETNQAATE